MLRKYNPEKEIKKIQKRGIYNPKIKLMIIGSIFLLTAVIATSYALFSYTSSQSVAFNGKATKIVKVTLNVTNGTYSNFATKILRDNNIRTETPDLGKGYPLYDTPSDKSLSGLYAAQDDDGTSYYFRGDGDLINNNVRFADKNWKIVRINGDGSVRIMATEKIPNSTPNIQNVGWTYNNGHACTQDNPCISDYKSGTFTNDYKGTDGYFKTIVETWYKSNLVTYDSKIALTTFCNDTSQTIDSSNYDSYAKRGLGNWVTTDFQPTLKCSDPTDISSNSPKTYGGVYKLKIGLITADELDYAGIDPSLGMNSAASNNFLNKSLLDYWTMTPENSALILRKNTGGNIAGTGIKTTSTSISIYPVINIKPEVNVIGSGTQDNPYMIQDTVSTGEISLEYNTESKIKMYPNEGYAYESAACTNSQSGTYDSENNIFKISPTKDTTCTIKFKPTLKGAILANNTLQTVTPDFTQGSPMYNGQENGYGLFAAQDDDGTSYYFRGIVENNNVKFAGKNWKIIRINGDGSIRLIYNDTGGPSSVAYNKEMTGHRFVGYTYNNNHFCTKISPCESNFNSGTFEYNYKSSNTKDSAIKESLETWYKNNLAKYDDRITLTTYCNDTSIKSTTSNKYYYYGPWYRMRSSASDHQPILTCPDPTDFESTQTHDYGGVYKLKIGLVNADELIMAGLKNNPTNTTTKRNYLYDITSDDVSTMSPSRSYAISADDITNKNNYAIVFMGYGGRIDDILYLTNNLNVAPVINLKPDVSYTTTGTGDQGSSTNPYTIS